eukprot:7128469-Prymnesium_polylepis.1
MCVDTAQGGATLRTRRICARAVQLHARPVGRARDLSAVCTSVRVAPRGAVDARVSPLATRRVGRVSVWLVA